MSIGKDYYKPILVKSGYNNNYVQYESKGDKILTLKEYLALIEQYLRNLINYYENKDEWKLQLTAEISFISLKPGSGETCAMHTKSDNEKIMNGSDMDEINEGLFESFLQKYEENLQEKMKESEFEFDGGDFLFLYVPHNTKEIHVVYKSKHNLTREKQVILLMISNGENWHYIVVKSLPGLLKGITSSHNGDFYCLNCFCAYTTKINLNNLKKYVKIINIVM